jgi:ABC-type dipeptide/oligopeptide/nickel transport system permease component
MLKFTLRRTAQALLVFVVVTFLCYVALYQLGNPFASIGEKLLPPQTQAILRETFQLDRPVPVQYLNYLANLFIARMARGSMLEVLESDYVRTARAKGLRPATVIFKHALRNAVIPIANIAAVELGVLLSGAVIVETIFQYNGVGYLFVRALNTPLLTDQTWTPTP